MLPALYRVEKSVQVQVLAAQCCTSLLSTAQTVGSLMQRLWSTNSLHGQRVSMRGPASVLSANHFMIVLH